MDNKIERYSEKPFSPGIMKDENGRFVDIADVRKLVYVTYVLSGTTKTTLAEIFNKYGLNVDDVKVPDL